MPLRVNSRDRKLFIGAGVMFVVLVGGALLFSGGQGTKEEAPTTYSTSSGGAKAAYLLLQALDYSAVRWEKPLSELDKTTARTLILAEPMEAPIKEERERLQEFIQSGGRVIATGMFAGTFLPESSSTPDPLAGMLWKGFPALSPSRMARVAPKITLAPQASWRSTVSATPLYGDNESVIVVKYGYGQGEVIWWASATPLTNAGLKEAGNLEFFLACLGEKNRGILWDEYIHGYRETLGASVAHSPVMWLFVQFGLLGLAVLMTFARRSGPIFAPVTDVRLSPLEFVHTLGGLYERADAASVAVDISYQRFRYWLVRRLGMATNASVEDLQLAVHDRWHFSDELFGSRLRECESARYDPRLTSARALQLIQELDSYAVKLKLFPVSRKERD